MELLNMAAHICFHVTVYVVPLNLMCNIDHIPKKLNFVPQLYPLCSPRGSNQGLQTKIPLIGFISIIPLPAKRLDRFGKILTFDFGIKKLNDWHLNPTKESGDGVNFETVMLTFKYWQPFIMQTRFKLDASKPLVRS